MIGILQLAKERLAQSANPEGIYVDFTMGKGRDTLFLASGSLRAGGFMPLMSSPPPSRRPALCSMRMGLKT